MVRREQPLGNDCEAPSAKNNQRATLLFKDNILVCFQPYGATNIISDLNQPEWQLIAAYHVTQLSVVTE